MITIMSDELLDCLRSYRHRKRDAPAGSVVFDRQVRVRNLFVIEAGVVELRRYTEDGDVLVLQRAIGPSVLAEASLYSDRYHCDAVVTTPATLLVFSKTTLLQSMTTDAKLIHLWGAYLSVAIQNARQRAEILSRRSVARRLDGWLAMHDGKMPSKGQWKRIAAEIGVTSEALYRELAKRRRGSAN